MIFSVQWFLTIEFLKYVSLLSSNLEILTIIFSNMCVRLFDKLPKITKSLFSFSILFLFVFKFWLLLFIWIQLLLPFICHPPSDINLLRIIHLRCNFQFQNFHLVLKYNFKFSAMITLLFIYVSISSVQLLSHVQLFATPWTAARQDSLSVTNSQSLLKLMSIGSVMPSNQDRKSVV